MGYNDIVAGMAMEGWKRKDARNSEIVVLPDGYNGATAKFYSSPIARDCGLVKLMCAEPGKEYMSRWALEVDVIKAMSDQRAL